MSGLNRRMVEEMKPNKLDGYAEGFGAGKMYAEIEFKEQIKNLEKALKTALLILRKASEK